MHFFSKFVFIGSFNTSFVDLDSLLLKSSHCQVPELSRPCFREPLVKMSSYSKMFCNSGNDDNMENVPSCMLTNQV